MSNPFASLQVLKALIPIHILNWLLFTSATNVPQTLLSSLTYTTVVAPSTVFLLCKPTKISVTLAPVHLSGLSFKHVPLLVQWAPDTPISWSHWSVCTFRSLCLKMFHPRSLNSWFFQHLGLCSNVTPERPATPSSYSIYIHHFTLLKWPFLVCRVLSVFAL